MAADLDVYGAFAEQLQQANTGSLSLLDEDDGLLVRWIAICEERLRQLEDDINPEETDSWTLERNTWQLVQSLYAERLSEAERELSPTVGQGEASTSKNPYTSPLSVAQKLVEKSHSLVELSAIRDWLQSIPTSLNPAEIRRGYLTYTKGKLKQARRTGGPPPRGLVQELDPDALLRSTGVRLEEDDAVYERALVRSLYEYVRAGLLDLAIDMCRQSDQSWRAASLSGGALFDDPALALGGEESLIGIEVEEERRAQGNENRRGWKMMCRKLAAATNVDAYERALYGAISGDATSVLPVCTSWEDHVWAHINSLLEAHIEIGRAHV